MAAAAPPAAVAAFPSNTNWAGHLSILRGFGDDPKSVVMHAGEADSGLGGVLTLLMQMDPKQVPGLADLLKRFQTANTTLIKNSRNEPISDLGIAGQIRMCFADTNQTLMANTWGLRASDLEAAVKKAQAIATGPITVAVLVLPRKDRNGNINSIHFVVLWWPKDRRDEIHAISSYNYQKGEGFSPNHQAVAAIWNKHGIARTSPPQQRNSFERLWETSPPNAALAVRDITHWGTWPKDQDIIDATFPTSAGKPEQVIYDAAWAVEIDDVAETVHSRMETTHQLAAIITEKLKTVSSAGPHAGSTNCLLLGCDPMSASIGQALAGLPIDRTFALLCENGSRFYKANGSGLLVAHYVNAKNNNFKISHKNEVLEEVVQAFQSPHLNQSRGEGRAAYGSQYVRFRDPHPDSDFMKCAMIIGRSAADVLEAYASNPANPEWNEIFGV
ncbi:MAG: hypothetical protein EOR16_31015 [Mesorhizobium sp.]|uniref:hypothetical protein n=1 Tax=Mesorhizobium sp. TaxID=1871066 RepID=UPI000FE73C80|nr:hypothetical protein [Mesorhizobium sp.]RWI50086.1 MAG: hypothetical protein EOR16_31015 [Mesorhizobium sp.]